MDPSKSAVDDMKEETKEGGRGTFYNKIHFAPISREFKNDLSLNKVISIKYSLTLA